MLSSHVMQSSTFTGIWRLIYHAAVTVSKNANVYQQH